jgi:hypothetical protein
MEQHSCLHEKELGELSAVVSRISKEVYGNGELGLAKTVPRLEEKINSLVHSVASHTQVISNFIEFQAVHNGEIKGKKELEERDKIAKELKATERRDKIQSRFLYISAILIFTGLLINAYFGFRNSKTPAIVKESIDNMEGISKVTRGGYVKYNDRGLSDSIKIK